MAMPRLPAEVTGVNTLILLCSAATMWLANRAIRFGQQQALTRMLLLTAVLGMVFLLVQGYEWVKLIGYGLTLSSGVYGATFYTLIGCHGLHVASGLVWLAVMMVQVALRGFLPSVTRRLTCFSLFWHALDIVWVWLFTIVYLLGVRA